MIVPPSAMNVLSASKSPVSAAAAWLAFPPMA